MIGLIRCHPRYSKGLFTHVVIEDGELKWQMCFFDGNLHRVDGPAHQQWNDEGKLIREEWWIDGNDKQVVKPSGCDGKLVTIDGKQYRLELV